jgi:CP family cyanate transporter-like MFS transporter
LISAVGPFGVGLLYDVTDGWTVPLWSLMALTVPQLVAGLTVARPSYIVDQLPRSRPFG